MRLSTAIRKYVQWRRFCGRTFYSGEKILFEFLKHVGDISLTRLTKQHVSSHLLDPKTRATIWRSRRGTLERFLRHWAARGEIKGIPLTLPRSEHRNPLTPHVYSREQIRKLIDAVETNQRHLNCVIDGGTLRAFLFFLYGTGACVGEALRLKTKDVDLAKGTIKLCRVAEARERTIPVVGRLKYILRVYRDALQESYKESEFFFVDKLSRPLNAITLSKTYHNLLRIAGVSRADGLKIRPHLQDFRHTFAVHTLTAWLNQRRDLRRMLPALSAYLGITKLASTERYFRMVPGRFHRQISALLGRTRRGPVRNPRSIRLLGKGSRVA